MLKQFSSVTSPQIPSFEAYSATPSQGLLFIDILLTIRRLGMLPSRRDQRFKLI